MDYDSEFWDIVNYVPPLDHFYSAVGQMPKCETNGGYAITTSLQNSLGHLTRKYDSK